MIRFLRAAKWILPALLSVAVIGCGPNYGGRQEVKGTIKLKGQPLNQAVIDFTPLESQPTKMGALITDGSYIIPRASGLMPGKYRVMITAGDGRTPENADGAPGPSGANIVSKELVPP